LPSLSASLAERDSAALISLSRANLPHATFCR
jgi:hypothetical protein